MDTVFNIPDLTALVLVVVGIWWFVPLYQRNRLLGVRPPLDGKDVYAMEDEYRKTVTQALGGIFVIATLVIAYKQLTDARSAIEAQLKSAQVNTQAQLESAQLNTNIQVAETEFAKGFDLLGSETVQQRVGGIRILDDWIKHGVVGELLTTKSKYDLVVPALVAMIRDETEFDLTRISCEEFARPKSKRVAEDVQAALEVIRPWTSFSGKNGLHLDYLNLAEADLSKFNLNNAHLQYSDLSGANVSNSTFNGASLYCINFYDANLENSNFSSTSDRTTVLSGALMTKARMDGAKFVRTDLRSANLSEAQIRGADFSAADLYNTNFFRAIVRSSLFDFVH